MTMNNGLIDTLELARRDAADQNGGLTMSQLKTETGYGVPTLRKMLWALKAEGNLEVFRVPMMRIDGVMTSTVCYRIRTREEIETQ